jgi:hypothetical protein
MKFVFLVLLVQILFPTVVTAQDLREEKTFLDTVNQSEKIRAEESFKGLYSDTLLIQDLKDEEAYLESLKDRSKGREVEAFNAPFVGITTDGEPEKGLYSLRTTGVSTAPISNAAKAFINTLNAEQKKSVQFEANDIEWRKWANQANYYRDGLWFEKMSEAQRTAAFDLIAASLSAKGLQLTRDAMRLNETLGELNDNNFAKYGQWKYWLSIMGDPSGSQPWGWQLDGHHLIINYLVIGDQVVMTPSFWGAEPTVAHAGKFKGTVVLTEETDQGLKLVQSLSPAQRKLAILDVNKSGVNILSQAFSDNAIIPNAGVLAADFSDQQKKQLREVIGLYVGNMRDDHARVRMTEVEEYLDETYFAWIGDIKDDSAFYYRIQSPVILIEFDHERPQGLVNLYEDKSAFKEHVHTVVRMPNGNDYGKDLLRQHHEKHAHGQLDENGVAHWHGESQGDADQSIAQGGVVITQD